MYVKHAQVIVFGRSDLGQVRAANEDAFVIVDLAMANAQPIEETTKPLALRAGDRGLLLAVSDGMGGAHAGEVASALTLSALQRGMAERAESAQAALEFSVTQANEQVLRAGREPGQEGMGATITAVIVYDGYAYVAEVGDSRAYVLRNGHLSQVTHDQSYVQQLMDAGTLTEEEGARFPFRNVLSQAIGGQADVVVAMNRLELRREDRLLLCSDGLTGSVPDAEIQRILSSHATLDAACFGLIAAANAAGGPDNITVVLADLDGEDLPVWTSDDRFAVDVVSLVAAPSPP